MTVGPDGTVLWVRGTNEVVDEREGLPLCVSPVNTSCQGQTVTFTSPRRTFFYAFSRHLKGSDTKKVETLSLYIDACGASEPDVFSSLSFCNASEKCIQSQYFYKPVNCYSRNASGPFFEQMFTC